MTVFTYKNKPVEKSFNNSLTDIFPDLASLYKQDVTHNIPVNIIETEKSYELEVMAPGRLKEDFKISLENNLLTIETEAKNEATIVEKKFLKKEFKLAPFKRSFTLDEKIDAEFISANYVNGILTLNLPKKAEVKPSIKNISIL